MGAGRSRGRRRFRRRGAVAVDLCGRRCRCRRGRPGRPRRNVTSRSPPRRPGRVGAGSPGPGGTRGCRTVGAADVHVVAGGTTQIVTYGPHVPSARRDAIRSSSAPPMRLGRRRPVAHDRSRCGQGRRGPRMARGRVAGGFAGTPQPEGASLVAGVPAGDPAQQRQGGGDDAERGTRRRNDSRSTRRRAGDPVVQLRGGNRCATGRPAPIATPRPASSGTAVSGRHPAQQPQRHAGEAQQLNGPLALGQPADHG